MASFLYFLGNARESQVRELLPMRGLSYVLAPGLRSRGTTTGPGGVAGVVVADRDRVDSKDVGYFPDRQAWRQVPGQDGVWVGMIRDQRPGPGDLVRKDALDGHAIELGDGNAWTVPVAVAWDGPPVCAFTRLPQQMELSSSGQWEFGDVIEQYRFLWAIACQWRDTKGRVAAYIDARGSFAGIEEPSLLNDWVYPRSVEILAVNYVIGQVEASMLGLFVTGRKWAVLDALIDQHGLNEIVSAATSNTTEKKTDDTPPITLG